MRSLEKSHAAPLFQSEMSKTAETPSQNKPQNPSANVKCDTAERVNSHENKRTALQVTKDTDTLERSLV